MIAVLRMGLNLPPKWPGDQKDTTGRNQKWWKKEERGQQLKRLVPQRHKMTQNNAKTIQNVTNDTKNRLNVRIPTLYLCVAIQNSTNRHKQHKSTQTTKATQHFALGGELISISIAPFTPYFNHFGFLPGPCTTQGNLCQGYI